MLVTEVTVEDNVSTIDGALKLEDSATEGFVTKDTGTTEGVPNVIVAEFEKLDPLTYL